MDKKLLNEIESFRRLSSYDTKMTLNENISLLSEAPVALNPQLMVRDVDTALGGIKAAMELLKIEGMTASRFTKLLEMDAKLFEKELAKAFSQDLKAGTLAGELGPTAKNLSKMDAIRRLSFEVKSTGKQLKPEQMRRIIDEVSSANKLKAAKFKPRVSKPKPPTPDEAKVAENEFTRVTDPTKNKWNWKRLAKWGAGIGLSTAALYYLYTKTHGEEPPIVTDDGDTTPPVPPPVPGISKYKPCSGTYNFNVCKSDVIAQVQGCLGGLVQDGKFGPKTQGKLQSQFPQFANSFTDADVDTICKKEGTNKLTTDVEDEELGSESSGTVDQSSNNQQTQTGGID